MKLTRDLGMILLAAWLILYGIAAIFSISFPQEGIVLGILALAAGILILIRR